MSGTRTTKYLLSRNSWEKLGKPSVNSQFYRNIRGVNVCFNIIEQGWTKSSVYLILKKKKNQ
jgi:hypothetical protein